jgi:hypothetical protein
MRGHGEAVFAAVYALTEGTADLFAVAAPGPHLFEWNLWNNGLISGAAIDPRLRGKIAFDFDGVLCHDTPFRHTDAEEEKAAEWYRTAPLKYRPTLVEIPLVVTFRLEKHRDVTEEWCRRWGVRIKRMVMHPAKTFAERDADFDVAGHKGTAFRESTCCLFIESDRNQAPIIAQAAGKPVIVPDTGEVFT